MISRRRVFLSIGAGALTAPFMSFGQQQPAKPARIGVLISASMSSYASRVEALRAGLRDLGEARSPSEFDGAFSAMAKKRVEAVEIVDDSMILGNLRAIAELAAHERLPSTGAKEFAEAGGLIGYGVDFAGTFRRAADFVDRIRRGTKPSDLPVEQATTFELVINGKTAKALGVTIPQQLLLRADRVME